MSGFAHSIKTAILLFPIVALIITIPYIIYQYHKYGSINAWRTIIIYSFVLYCLSAYFLVILPLPSLEYVQKMAPPVNNFIPFSFVGELFTKAGLQLNDFATYFPTMKNPTFYEAIFNIFLTVPLGVYLHYYFKCSLKKTVLISFLVTLFFELTQLSGLYFIYPRQYRVFDVDDLILNTFGGLVGYWLGFICLHILPTRDEIDMESYQKGQEISFLRRLVSMGIDLFLLGLLLFVFGMYIYFTTLTKIWLLLPIMLYILFIIIGKKTVGMALLNLEFSSYRDVNVSRIRIVIYYLLLIIQYLLLPILSVFIAYICYRTSYFNRGMFEYILVVIFAICLMMIVIASLKRILKMPLVCEQISGVALKSNILVNEVKDE